MRKRLASLLLLIVAAAVLTACDGFELPLPQMNTYTVTFNTHGGNPVSALKVDKDTTMNLPVAIKEGHNFLGWYKEAEYSVLFTETDIVESNMTLHAKWAVNTYTVYFDTRGGNSLSPMTFAYGEVVVLPIDPLQEDAVFLGWYKDASLLQPYTAAVMPAEDLTLYARWHYPQDDSYDFLAVDPDTDLVTFEAFVNYFDYILFNRITSATVMFIYEFDDISTEINAAFEAKHIQSNVSMQFSYNPNNKELDITATYNDEAYLSASENPVYVQRPFYQTAFTSTRDEHFEVFKIDDIERTYPVVTSDQLYYVMEKGYRPVFEVQDTPAEAMYEAARTVLREIVDDSMTDVEKLKAIYQWLVDHVYYDGALLDKLIAGESNLNRYKGFFLEGVFEDGRAVCDGYSKALLVMGRMEGIEVIRVVGRPADPANTVLHAWNKVYLGEQWYVIDATSANLILSQTTEIYSNAFFMIDDASYATRYVATSNLDIVAEGSFDIYSQLTFQINDIEYTRLIDSQEALNALFSYYVSLGEPYLSIDALIDFDYGENFSDAIQQAFQASGLSGLGYSWVDDVFIFWQSDLS